MSSFDFSAPSDEDPFPKPNDGAAAGAVGGFVPNVNAGADDAAAPDSGADVPKENGDGDVDAVSDGIELSKIKAPWIRQLIVENHYNNIAVD